MDFNNNLKFTKMETKELKEKSFEELIKEAANIADARKKIFNDLIESVKNKYIPALTNVMKGYNLVVCYFDFDKKVAAELNGTYISCDDDEERYAIAIYQDGKISDACYDYLRGKWNSSDKKYSLDEVKFLKICAIELALKIRTRILLLNERYKSLNEKAEQLIK